MEKKVCTSVCDKIKTEESLVTSATNTSVPNIPAAILLVGAYRILKAGKIGFLVKNVSNIEEGKIGAQIGLKVDDKVLKEIQIVGRIETSGYDSTSSIPTTLKKGKKRGLLNRVRHKFIMCKRIIVFNLLMKTIRKLRRKIKT